MCQVSRKAWPRATPRRRLAPYFTNLIAIGQRGTPLPNFHITATLPRCPYFIFKKQNKSKNRTKYTLYKDGLDASAILCLLGCTHNSVIVGCPVPKIIAWGLFPSRLSFPQSSEPREPGQARSHECDIHWTLRTVRAESGIH